MWLTLYFYCILILPWEAGLLLLKTRQSQANQNELVDLPQVSTPDLILRALGQAGLRNHQTWRCLRMFRADIKFQLLQACGSLSPLNPVKNTPTEAAGEKRNGGSPWLSSGISLLGAVLYD